MSDEAALLAAIVANAEDDTPRLVYADWLDEHEAPIQAEFVRTQCRLASGSAADPDYPDLLEHYAELVARFSVAVKLTAPALPPGFIHQSDIRHGADHFRRGFLHVASGEWSPDWYYTPPAPTNLQIDRVCDGLTPLVANTTVRHLVLDGLTADLLARVLVAPGVAALTGLTVQPAEFGWNAGDAIVAALARAKAVAGLERLELDSAVTVAGLCALDSAKLDRLHTLHVSDVQGRARDVPTLAQAKWFRGLRHVSASVVRTPRQSLLAALARLPHLESLDVGFGQGFARKTFGTVTGFPVLTRLTCNAVNGAAGHLARGQFPRLAELVAPGVWPDAFRALLAAKWLSQLRVLDVSHGALTDASVVAFSQSTAAPHLRILRIGHNRFAKAGLMALTDGARFTNLTTLDIRTGNTSVRPATMAQFAANLSLPHVRHLSLGGWPLGDAGAKALAKNPNLANVTRLMLDRCGIGELGFTALVRSPYLQQLVELDIGNNNLKTAAALLDTARLPHLAAFGLYNNPLTGPAREKLHRVRGWVA